MSSFTENLYLKLAIKKLQEENQQLLQLLNEVEISADIRPPTPPTLPRPTGPSRPTTLPRPTRPSRPTPLSTPVTQRSVSQGGSPPPPSIPPSGPFPFPPSEPTSPRPLPTPNPPINPKSVGQRSASQGGGLDYLDPMYGRGRFPLKYDRTPIETPLPSSMPFNQKTPLPFTLPANQPFSLNRPYDPNDDPNNFRPTRGMGDGGI